MRTIIRASSSALAAGALLLPAHTATYPDAVLNLGPVAYWRMEAAGPLKTETAANRGSLGAAANGEYVGGPDLQVPGALAGDANPAAAFDGASLMKVPYSADLNPNPPFTIEAWVKPNVVLSDGFASPVSSINRTPPAAEGWIFYQTPTTWNFRLGDSANNYTVSLNSTTTIEAGQWYHLVATYDGTTATLYVNGVPEASQTSSNFAPNPSVPFGIGGRGDNAFYFNGVVDEVAFYPSVLSADAIQAHYENAIAASPDQPYDQLVLSANPLAYWRLDDAPNRTETINLGSLGEDYNGLYQPGCTPGQPGPDPTNWAPGFENSNPAVELDGASGFILVKEPLNLNTNTVTIVCWIQPFGGQADYAGVVFARGGDTVAGLDFVAQTGHLGYHWNDSPATYNWDSGLTPIDSLWNFVALVVEPDQATLYLNDGFGLLSATNAVSHAPEEFNGPLRIGLDSGSRFFVGVIDEVAIFDRALTPGEIMTLSYAGFGSTNPPEILAQPAAPAEGIYEGGSFTLSVDAAGEPPLSYQWRKDGVDIPGANGPVYSVENATVADSGSYTVVVSNAYGATPSDPVNVVVQATGLPTFTRTPEPVTVYAGGRAVFQAEATGAVQIDYQWQFNGTDLPGATNTTLVLTGVTPDQAGQYALKATTTAGSAISPSATLTVIEPEPGTYPAAVMEDGPVGYWRLGETSGPTAFDLAGGHHGEYLNSPLLGQPGALKDDPDTAAGFFAESLTKVDVPYSPDLNPTQFSVELWAKVAPGSSGYRSPLTSRDDGPQRGYIFYATPANVWQFWLGTGSGWGSLTGTPIEEDTWTYLAATYDGTTARLYVNGAEVASGNIPLALNTAQVLRIGGGATETDGNYFFAGDVDEVAVYDHVLPPERIQLHYGAGLGAGTPPSIVQQPADQAILAGETAVFTVVAAGSLPLSYQWQFNGTDIPGATEPSLELTNVQADQAGAYQVVVSNPAGVITSEPAMLEVVTPPEQPYAQVVLADNPVAYWRLGETSGSTLLDSAGNHHGSYMNGPTLGQPGALVGDPDTAVGFNAALQTKAEVPWSPDLNTPVFTVEVWARVTGGSGYRSPLTSRADAPQRGYIFYATPANIWQFWTGTGAGWNGLSGPGVSVGEWTHLVGTYDGAVKRFYVNGRLVAQGESAFVPNDTALLRIGGGASEDPTGSFFFEGDVDEAAFYDHVLTPAQVLTHYVAGRPPRQAPSIRIERTPEGIVLTWENGVLEAAPAVTGPWQTVEGATSPLTLTPAEAWQFFRAVRP